ncbi:MAG: hypothetical protein GYA24_15115 [Candidatus Lokiarchaeota archaeon]|nr:hypothetical protein [Candidatus Lokiarchaeota archaeon]
MANVMEIHASGTRSFCIAWRGEIFFDMPISAPIRMVLSPRQDPVHFQEVKRFSISTARATRRHGINGSPVLGIKIGDVENHDDRYHVRSRRDPAGVNRHPTSSTFKHCPVAGVASRRENGGLAPETRRTLPAYEGTRTRGPHAPPWIDGCLEPACRGYMITI